MMLPEYDKYPRVSFDGINFINGDSMDFLRWMRENLKYKFFDIAIVDPPYGVNMGVGKMQMGGSKEKPVKYDMGNKWDANVPEQEYWDLLNYCSKNFIVWGGNYFVKELGQTKNLFSKESIEGICNGRCFIVWDKGDVNNSFAPCELALTSFDKNSMFIRKSRHFKGVDDEKDRRHPTQKPVYLYDYLYLKFCQKGFKILDTHGGSHTHAIAAYKNGANLVIIEAYEKFHKEGIEAFKKHYLSPRLAF